MLPHRRLPSSTFSPICLLSSRKLWASFKMALIGVYPHDLFHRAARMLQSYELMYWDAMAGAAGVPLDPGE